MKVGHFVQDLRGGFVAKLKNDKQEKFCLEYIKTGNQTQAAINAGYSKRSAKNTASRMMTYDDFKYIPERIAELTAKSSKRNNLIADAEEVLEFISNVMRGDEEDAEIRDKLKAAEMLGKKYAMFTDNVNNTVEIKESKISETIQAIKDSK